MANELYEILQILPTATQREIKVAYFNLVRNYSPEREPEQFRKIRDAYETLRDPKARANYDSLQSHGATIENLSAKASKQMDRGNWAQAAKALEEILQLAPGLEWVANNLGRCYRNLEEWAKGEKVYQTLTKEASDVPIYWANYGTLLLAKGQALNNQNYISQARAQFEQAKKLEPRNSQYYVDIAETYFHQDDYRQSLHWVDLAIHADDEIDEDDLEAFIFKAIVYWGQGDLSKITAVAREIKAIPTATPGFLEHASRRLSAFGLDLLEKELFQDAHAFFAAALQLSNEESLAELHKVTKSLAVAEEEWKSLQDDPKVIEPLRGFALVNLVRFTDKSLDQNQIVDNIIVLLFLEHTSTELTNSLRQLKTRYPGTMELGAERWDLMNEISDYSTTYNEVKNDPRIAPPLKFLALNTVLNFFGIKEGNDEFKQIINALGDYSNETIQQGVVAIKHSYSKIYQINPKMFDELISLSAPRSAKPTTAATSASSGCLIPTALFVVGFIVLSSLLF